jgi:hypothetical protein
LQLPSAIAVYLLQAFRENWFSRLASRK